MAYLAVPKKKRTHGGWGTGWMGLSRKNRKPKTKNKMTTEEALAKDSVIIKRYDSKGNLI